MPDHYYVEDFEDGTLTSSTGRIDRHPLVASPLTASDGHHGYSSPRGDGADNLIADTLTSGSHPASNTPGRRREDDYNLVITGPLGGGDNGIGRRTQDDPNLVPVYPLARRGREGGSELEVGALGTYNALRAGNGGSSRLNQVMVGTGVRRLTPRECERLQGFPDDWTLIPGASDSKRYAALGDAVTVPVAEWLGRRLMEVAA